MTGTARCGGDSGVLFDMEFCCMFFFIIRMFKEAEKNYSFFFFLTFVFIWAQKLLSVKGVLKVTLEKEMKKSLLRFLFLPGEQHSNSIWASAGWQQWKISWGLWSPHAPERANWTNQTWVMLQYIGVIQMMNGVSTASQILSPFQRLLLFQSRQHNQNE